MLSQKEVYDIMKNDILELQRKRITELEDAIFEFSNLSDGALDTVTAELAEDLLKVARKGVSL